MLYDLDADDRAYYSKITVLLWQLSIIEEDEFDEFSSLAWIFDLSY